MGALTTTTHTLLEVHSVQQHYVTNRYRPQPIGRSLCACAQNEIRNTHSQNVNTEKHNTRFYVETRIGKTTGGPQTP